MIGYNVEAASRRLFPYSIDLQQRDAAAIIKKIVSCNGIEKHLVGSRARRYMGCNNLIFLAVASRGNLNYGIAKLFITWPKVHRGGH